MKRDTRKTIQLFPKSAERIELEQEFLQLSYDLEVEESTEAGTTGLLTLFQLKSSDPKLPSFRARWDLKQDDVDVDLLDRANESELFKAGKNGYRGHHNAKLGDRRYLIDIAIPGQDIFRGVLEFRASASAHLQPEDIILNIKDSLRITRADTGEELVNIPFPDEQGKQ